MVVILSHRGTLGFYLWINVVNIQDGSRLWYYDDFFKLWIEKWGKKNTKWEKTWNFLTFFFHLVRRHEEFYHYVGYDASLGLVFLLYWIGTGNYHCRLNNRIFIWFFEFCSKSFFFSFFVFFFFFFFFFLFFFSFFWFRRPFSGLILAFKLLLPRLHLYIPSFHLNIVVSSRITLIITAFFLSIIAWTFPLTPIL